MDSQRAFYLLGLFTLAAVGHAQDADRLIRQGNDRFHQGDLNGAVQYYEKAGVDQRALFNKGNALFLIDSLRDAAAHYENAAAASTDANEQARAYHNLGNSYAQQQDFAKAIAAYKQALLRNPTDEDTRYNLAYAQKKLKEQQQENQDKDKDQQQKKDEEKKEESKEDKQEEEQQQEEQKKKEQEQEQGQEKEQEQNKSGDQQQQPRPQGISKQDAERMLDALEDKEKEVLQKVQEQQRPAKRITIEKDW